jgi:uncharacterized protein
MRIWFPVLAVTCCLVASGSVGCGTAGAQQATGSVLTVAPPQIIVSGMGETRVTPDRAIINIGVYSRAATAAAAARENARKQQTIVDTLIALGFGRDQISTLNYSVSPEMRQLPQSGRMEVTGYTVSNTVRVDVRRLDQIGPAIDASLAKGANQINGLDFYVSNSDEPRRRALTQAIERARLDADAIARAAGGSLGALLEISTSGAGGPIIMRREMAMMGRAQAADVQTPIEPGEEMVRVVVNARWQFMPGGR